MFGGDQTNTACSSNAFDRERFWRSHLTPYVPWRKNGMVSIKDLEQKMRTGKLKAIIILHTDTNLWGPAVPQRFITLNCKIWAVNQKKPLITTRVRCQNIPARRDHLRDKWKKTGQTVSTRTSDKSFFFLLCYLANCQLSFSTVRMWNFFPTRVEIW